MRTSYQYRLRLTPRGEQEKVDIIEQLVEDGVLVQQNHPEMRQGEIYVCNINRPDFDRAAYRTKRLGMVAYDRQGFPLYQPPQISSGKMIMFGQDGLQVLPLYPFFVSREEFLKRREERLSKSDRL